MKDNTPAIHFERYADDIVVHCRSYKQLEWIRKQIEERLKLCKLRLHPEKTRVVYCKDSNRTGGWPQQGFDFLGYRFRPRSARNQRGELFVSFSPAISPKAARSLGHLAMSLEPARSRATGGARSAAPNICESRV